MARFRGWSVIGFDRMRSILIVLRVLLPGTDQEIAHLKQRSLAE
jgi:hypothetical protein